MKIRSLEDLRAFSSPDDHVLTLFSGGLDSSYVLHALAQVNCRVTALCVDVGDDVEPSALEATVAHFGAALRIVDAREDFAVKAVLPAIYMGIYPISSSLSRPIIALHAVALARELGCQAIVHTANQSQNSLRRLNGAIEQLGYEGCYGSPYEYSAIPREQKIEALARAGLHGFKSRTVSGDANLWCREFESGELENPEDFVVPESLYCWSRRGSVDAPSGLGVSIAFEQGTPMRLGAERLAPTALIDRLNRQVGAFGVGRYAGLEHLEHGEKVLEIREAPAAQLLLDAYRHLETATLDAELLREKQSLEQVWVREAIEGRWYGDLKAAAEAFILHTAQRVTGTVSYLLRQGSADLCAVRATQPRYLKERDRWEVAVALERGERRLIRPR
jgi:argininosuccinate synthase